MSPPPRRSSPARTASRSAPPSRSPSRCRSSASRPACSAGKVRVAEWKDGQEPLLQVDKRGRFITNMGFANVVTAAVDSDDKRIKGSCMVILEEGDPGIWDRGTPTKKLVHQLSSTNDPVFNLTRSRQPHRRRLHDQGRRHHPELFARRDHRGRVPPHARHRRPDDLGETALRRRAGDPLPAPPLPRRRRRARHAALRTRPPAEGRRAAPPAWTSGPPARRAPRSASKPRGLFDEADPLEKQKDRLARGEAVDRPRRVQGTGQDNRTRWSWCRSIPSPSAQRDCNALTNWKPTRWFNSPCSTRWPTSSAPRASSGTPATAPT